MNAQCLIQVGLVIQLRPSGTVTPHRKFPFDEGNDREMKCVRIQQGGIGSADARIWARFVGDHTVDSKAEGSKVCQGFVRIAQSDGAQPVAQAVRFDEEDEWAIENAHDAHRG